MRYLLLLLVATSCSPLYLPNTRNAPLFREGGEAQLSLYATTAGADAQVAYALADHIAVTGNFSYGTIKKSDPDYTKKNLYYEAGLGFYGRSKTARYEVFAGYGMGEGNSSDQYYFYGLNNDVVATGKMTRIFLQPSIGTNNRDVNLSFTPRFSWVDYSEFTTETPVLAPFSTTVSPNEDPIIFLEPAIALKTRLKGNIFALIQLGLTTPIAGEPYFDYQPLQLSFGLQIDTGGLRTRVY